jgi:hypothetical protein
MEAILRLCSGVRNRMAVRHGLVAGLVICLAVLLCPRELGAQAVSRINGTVIDQADAAVPDAKVTVTNVDTNVSQTAFTTSAGTYLVIDLIPGAYIVRVEKAGFKSFVDKNVIVVGGATSTANATLVPGTVTESIEVTAPSVALQTEQPEIGTTISQTLTEELPQLVSGDMRQIDSFIFLTPGVTGDGFSHRINGGVDQQTEVMFNGVPEAFSETAGFTTWNQPPYDSIKDVAVLTGTFSAQYGLGQGVEQYNTKSGSNALHGDAFFFYRDAYFDAPGAYNDINPNNKGVLGAPNTDHETDWGFSLGGPVVLPKIYNGRNKTFWFFSIDKYRFARGQGPVTVPTPAEIGGDFSRLVNPTTGAAIPIFVPIAWNANPSFKPAGCSVPASGPGSPGTQWPGNIIPQSCFSTNSKALLSFVPQPSVPFTTPGSENRNYSPSYVPVQTDRSWMFNVDHNLTSKQALHVLYWRQYHYVPAGWTNNVLNNQTWNYEPAYGIEPRYSYGISPNLVMTAGVLWVHQNNDFYQTAPPPSGGFNAVQPGPYGGSFLPGINFGGGPWEPISWGTGGWQYSINHKYGVSILNNWLYQHGRHTLNFGVDIRKTWQRDYECQGCAGNFSFISETTADPNETTNFKSAPGTNTGNGFASFLLGNAASANRQFAGDTRLSNTYVAPYFQDDTKITPRLSFNWGVRWDLAFPFANDNKYNQLTFFDANVANTAAINPKTGRPLIGGMTALGAAGAECPACVGWNRMDMIWNHFSPRVGITYQLNSKTVLLAGASWYWLDTGAFEYGVNKTAVNYGNNLNGTIGLDPLPNQVPGYGQWDGNPLAAPAKLPLTTGFLNTQSPHELVKHVKQAYDEQFVVGIQRELPWNMFLSVSGVHTHDLHLPSGLNPTNALNYSFVKNTCQQGPSALFYQQCVLGQSWTSPAAQALYQAAGFGQATVAVGGCPAGSPLGGFSGGPYYAPYANFGCDYGASGLALRGFLPFPMFRRIRNNFETLGADKYNALQVSLQKRTGSALTFLVAYTLSRTLSNSDSGFSTFNFKGLNPANQAAEWSVGNDDRTHVLTMAGVYELPLGPGKKFLNRGGTAMRNVVGGWKLSMVNRYQSGRPVNIVSCNGTFNCSPLAYTPQGNTANFVAAGGFDVNWSGANYSPSTTPAFNPNKFQFPGAWTIGNAAPLYNGFRFPAYYNEDLSLTKKFFFGERFSGELSMQFFNVLNRMLSGACTDTNVGSTNFGRNTQPGIPCQGNAPRRGQAELKIIF